MRCSLKQHHHAPTHTVISAPAPGHHQPPACWGGDQGCVQPAVTAKHMTYQAVIRPLLDAIKEQATRGKLTRRQPFSRDRTWLDH